MTAVVNAFTGANGTALATGNVAGFNLVSGTAPVITGNKAVFVGASAATSLLRVNLDGSNGTSPTASASGAAECLFSPMNPAPTSDEILISFRHSAGSAATVRHAPTTGKVKGVLADGTTIAWSSTNSYIADDIRVMAWATVGTISTGRLHIEIYVGMDRAPVETYDSGATLNLGTNQLVAIQVGRQLTPAYARTETIADLRVEAGRTSGFGPLMPTLDTIGLGVVGDSQVNQSGLGTGDGGLVESNLVTYGGWDAAHVSVDGVVGRSVIGTAVLPSAPQVIDTWRINGFDPRTWLILLGGNGIHSDLASQKGYINGLLDKIVNTTTGVYRVYWGNVVRQDTSDVEVDRFWQALQEVQAARTDCQFLIYNLDDAIHNGRDETNIWYGDGVHMSTVGYVIRNQLVGAWATLAGALPGVIFRRRNRVGRLRSRIG